MLSILRLQNSPHLRWRPRNARIKRGESLEKPRITTGYTSDRVHSEGLLVCISKRLSCHRKRGVDQRCSIQLQGAIGIGHRTPKMITHRHSLIQLQGVSCANGSRERVAERTTSISRSARSLDLKTWYLRSRPSGIRSESEEVTLLRHASFPLFLWKARMFF